MGQRCSEMSGSSSEASCFEVSNDNHGEPSGCDLPQEVHDNEVVVQEPPGTIRSVQDIECPDDCSKVELESAEESTVKFIKDTGVSEEVVEQQPERYPDKVLVHIPLVDQIFQAEGGIYEEVEDGMNEYLANASCECEKERRSYTYCLCGRRKDVQQHSLRRKLKTFSFGKKQRLKGKLCGKDQVAAHARKKKSNWTFKLNCTLMNSPTRDADIPESCVCTGYKRTEDSSAAAAAAEEPTVDLAKFNPETYPIDDADDLARAERAREIQEGVEAPPGTTVPLVYSGEITIERLSALFHRQLGMYGREPEIMTVLSHLVRPVHTQIDYIHCLVPDLLEITNCSFYWGKMDRYEAERLLDNKAEGTFLLRDSAQEEYLFSVSFRRYGRSLHARIEQWNHNFSFDSHDPGVFSCSSVRGLIEHYKDPSCCMFFEPMLTIPLHRKFVFPLQHLCRAVICKQTTYDGINVLRLPKALKDYLKEYHYKQRVRVRRLEV